MKKFDKEEIVKTVRKAGVVGAGGAGFPTYVKLTAKVDYLLINGAECEPLLAVDQLLMERFAEELVYTANTLLKALGAREAIFCIKQKYQEAHQQIAEATRKFKNIKVQLLEDLYPAGDEQVLVYEVLGRIVPEGGIPIQVGAVVINVETLLNVHYAISVSQPVTHTFLTINGDIAKPCTLRVPVGISFKELLRLSGNNISESTHLLIEGGPMMGKVISDWSAPVVKATKALIVAKHGSYLALRYINLLREIGKNVVSICCDCRQCTELCPRYLLGHTIEPHRLMVAEAQGLSHNERIFHQAQFCCECGICELYACFMFLSPRSLNAGLRKEFAQRCLKIPPFKKEFKVHSLRAQRRLPSRRIKAKLEITKYDRNGRFVEFPETEVKEATLPLRQHIGVPCKPIVKEGEKVKTAQMVADVAPEDLGVPIHSPIDGRVSEIKPDKIIIRQ